VAKNSGSLKAFLCWFDVNVGDSLDLRKMSPATLAAFGLGWYISDTLTRDEKQQWQHQMDEEFNRSIKNQDEAQRVRELGRSGRRLKKSAYDELQGYYHGLIR
jgi:hypothetical protein